MVVRKFLEWHARNFTCIWTEKKVKRFGSKICIGASETLLIFEQKKEFVVCRIF